METYFQIVPLERLFAGWRTEVSYEAQILANDCCISQCCYAYSRSIHSILFDTLRSDLANEIAS